MRDFSWNCFQVTGSVDAYLLFKCLEHSFDPRNEEDQEQEEEEKYLES